MKSHNKHFRTLLVLLNISILLASSCSPSVAVTEQPTETIVISATLPVIADTPTFLPIVETLSPSTLQPKIELSLEQECIPVEEKIPDNLTISGVWVANRGKPYLENLNEHVKYEVPLKGGGIFSTYPGDMAISPDGRHLAYIDSYLDSTKGKTDERILRIIKSSGHSVEIDYWKDNWQSIIGWIDNENIALFTGKKEIVILNPFTGSWKKFQKPQWLPQKKNKYDYFPYHFYSPTLKLVLIQPDYKSMEIKDTQTGEIIWSKNPGVVSTWSADGSTIAVVSNNSISIINENKRVLEFNTNKLEIASPIDAVLSRDNQKLFLYSFHSANFTFVDFGQLKAYKLCTNEYEATLWNSPFWSPNSRFIIQSVYATNYQTFDLLIDTQQLQAYKLASGQGQHRLVWLAEP